MAHFLHLPDECILAILQYVPLQNLILIRAVCLRLEALVEQVCRPKKYLKLFSKIGTTLSQYITELSTNGLLYQREFWLNDGECDDQLQLFDTNQTNNNHLSHFITSLFPNIRHLVICFHRSDGMFFNAMSHLLTTCSRIETLLLVEPSYDACGKVLLPPTMQSLKHLYLLYPSFDGINILPARVMSRLETLAIDGQCNIINTDFDISMVLQNLGPNCQSLCLSKLKCNAQSLVGLDLANLTHFSMYSIYCDYPFSALCNAVSMLKFINTNFSSIDTIAIDVRPENISQISELTALPKLTTLKLDLTALTLELLNRRNLEICRPLNSLKSFHIRIRAQFTYPEVVIDYDFSPIFPALEEVVVYCSIHYNCDHLLRLEKAFFKLRRPLRKFTVVKI